MFNIKKDWFVCKTQESLLYSHITVKNNNFMDSSSSCNEEQVFMTQLTLPLNPPPYLKSRFHNMVLTPPEESALSG